MGRSGSYLELDSDRAFQERFWTVQRVAWIGMALFTLIAVLGFTGAGGRWARGTEAAGTVIVDYPRVARWQRAEQLTIELPPTNSEQSVVVLGEDFHKLFSVESVMPEPAETRATKDGTAFTFRRTEKSVSIAFAIRPTRPAIAASVPIRVDGSSAILPLNVLP
jgi:hypothetical protein